MNPNSFTALLDFDRSQPIPEPPPALQKDAHGLPDLPTAFELNELHNSALVTGISGAATPSGSQTPLTPLIPHDLEQSRPASPEHGQVVVALQTMRSPPINRYRVLAACLMNFGNGMNDSAPGALIPYMEKDYSIGYAVVSLIFVANAIGFVSGAPLIQALQARVGRSKSYALAEAIIAIAYIMLVCHLPFPAVVVAFFLLGLGISFNLALNNVFCANLANSMTILGWLNGAYGIGGTIGPLTATSLVMHGRAWPTYYFVTLGVACFNLLFAFFSFRSFEHDTTAADSGRANAERNPREGSHSLGKALRHKATILGALFIFAYQGAEVSISGWVISFLTSYRHSSPSRVGYVTSGFWAGITLGRFLLSHPCHRFGEKRSTFFLIIGATAFQLLVWFVPNTIGEAVAVAFVGLLLGPIYPCATAVCSRLIPTRLQMSSLAAISALGSSGGAVAPFFTGLLAQSYGTWVLHPICIGLFAGMVICWAALPKMTKRVE